MVRYPLKSCSAIIPNIIFNRANFKQTKTRMKARTRKMMMSSMTTKMTRKMTMMMMTKMKSHQQRRSNGQNKLKRDDVTKTRGTSEGQFWISVHPALDATYLYWNVNKQHTILQQMIKWCGHLLWGRWLLTSDYNCASRVEVPSHLGTRHKLTIHNRMASCSCLIASISSLVTCN